jgi:hypothetical protein
MYTLLIERAESREVPGYGLVEYVRGIMFDTDEETGAKSVCDIIEATKGHNGELLIETMADGFPGWRFEGWQVQETNMGRARSNRTMIRKIVEQLP